MQKSQTLKANVDVAKYHTYGIHVQARYLIEVYSSSDLVEAVRKANKQHMQYVILGRGSNVLFKSSVYPGLVIINKTSTITVDGTCVVAESGVNTQILARKTARIGLSGLQWLVGVPGTVGGAVFMNAGCSGKQMEDSLEYVNVYYEGKMLKLTKDECNFSYRSSLFQKGQYVILSACFNLERDEQARDEIHEHQKKRLLTQPIEKRNSGCIFTNPVGHSAGALIDKCGLKGLEVGGASVSTKHANFINNQKDASAKDILKLINIVKQRVKEQEGVELEKEIRLL